MTHYGQQQSITATATADPPCAPPEPLALPNLVITFAGLAPLLAGELRKYAPLNSYLLAAGMNQILEDYLNPYPRLLSGLPEYVAKLRLPFSQSAVGVLPLARRSRRPAALATQASLPYGWGTGGLVSTERLCSEDIRAVLADLATGVSGCTYVRPSFHHSADWSATNHPGFVALPRLVHVLDLDGGFDRVWKERFSDETRRGLRLAERKAQKAGLEVELSTGGKLVPAFYGVYMRWIDGRARKRHMPLALARWLGQRREPLVKFQEVASRLGEACRIRVARVNGRPVAADITLIHNANAVGWRCYSDQAVAGRLRVVELLHRMVIEEACQMACRYFQMGESGSVASLERVKARFGGIPRYLVEYRSQRLPIYGATGSSATSGGRSAPPPYAKYYGEGMPMTRADAYLRCLVKRLTRFKERADP